MSDDQNNGNDNDSVSVSDSDDYECDNKMQREIKDANAHSHVSYIEAALLPPSKPESLFLVDFNNDHQVIAPKVAKKTYTPGMLKVFQMLHNTIFLHCNVNGDGGYPLPELIACCLKYASCDVKDVVSFYYFYHNVFL